MGNCNGKLTEGQLATIIGGERARYVVAQDKRCAEVYDDMEHRTKAMENVGREARACKEDGR